jgi:rhamnose transport system permease protein
MKTSVLSYKKPFSFSSFFLRWEWILVGLIIFSSVFNITLSPNFLNPVNLFDMTFNFIERGFITLTMIFVIISGNMDFSVASTAAMSSAILGKVYMASGNIWLGLVAGLCVGLAAGIINGLIVTRIKIPAFVATLGTYALYRGITWIILENVAITNLPQDFTFFGQGYIPGTIIPIPLVVYLLMLIPCGLILHRSTFGRYTFAIGGNREACRYAGVNINKIVMIIFIASGLMSALAGAFMAARFASIRADMATGMELDVVIAVVLGGVDIMGGIGTLPGVVLSLFLLGIVRFGMNLINIPAQQQIIVTGLLLIVSIYIPQVINRFSIRKSSK